MKTSMSAGIILAILCGMTLMTVAGLRASEGALPGMKRFSSESTRPGRGAPKIDGENPASRGALPKGRESLHSALDVDFLPVYSSFFTGKGTYEKFYTRAGTIDPITEKISGAIVPHHLLVGTAFARFYQALRLQKPSVIVIVGPNHFGKGRGAILTADGRYDTPYGPVVIDEAITTELLQSPLVQSDREPFIREHSISAEVAFIARTWPGTKIVPIILKTDVMQRESEALGALLHTTLPDDALVLASVDFSHYLPEVVADFHDQASEAAIRSFDLPRVMRLEIDSPASIATLLTFLEARGTQRIVFHDHTNSASFTHHPEFEETTSHEFMAFGKGEVDHAIGISVLLMGDAIFGRGIEQRFKRERSHMLDTLAGQEDRFLRGSDLNVLNLEGPITGAPAVKKKLVNFAFRKTVATPLLKRLRVNAVHTANNHWMDSGETGVADTLGALKQLAIDPIGSPKPCFRKVIDHATLGICGFDDTNDRLDQEATLEIIRSEHALVDRLIVTIHWGKEGHLEATKRQHELAHAFIDAGADAVVGHHPHVVQPLEIYKHRPILYSLGNLLFDQPDPTLSSGLALGLFFGEEETTIYLYPLKTVNGEPRVLGYEERTKFYEKYLRSVEESRNTGLQGKVKLPQKEMSH